MLEFKTPSAKLGPRSGRWVGLPRWPASEIQQTTLYIGDAGLTSMPGSACPKAVSTPQHLGEACEYLCAGMRIGDGLPGDQRDDDALSVCFDSKPLDRDMVLLRAPSLKLRFASDKRAALLAVRLCAVAPERSSKRITWRPINLTHRQFHAEPGRLIPGQGADLDIPLIHIGYSVPAGHRLWPAISTTCWPMLWPSPAVATVTLYPESAFLSLSQLLDGGKNLEIALPEAPHIRCWLG